MREYEEKNTDEGGKFINRRKSLIYSSLSFGTLAVAEILFAAGFISGFECVRYLSGERDIPSIQFYSESSEYKKGVPQLQSTINKLEIALTKEESNSKEYDLINSRLQEVKEKISLYQDSEENIYKKLYEITNFFDNWSEEMSITIRKQGNAQEIIEETDEFLTNL